MGHKLKTQENEQPNPNDKTNKDLYIATTVRIPIEVWRATCQRLLDEPDMPSKNEFFMEFVEQYTKGVLVRRNGEIYRARNTRAS